MAGERGRPRTFDTDQALDQALHVFWKHGFQDASMQELTQSMGLSKPSLYAAFGDKEALYLKALERYIGLLMARHGQMLQAEPDGRCAVEGFLRSMAGMLADPSLPGGCFIINGTADCGGSTIPAAVEEALQKALRASENLLLERLQRAHEEGHLAGSASPQELAALFMALLAGLAVMAKSGADVQKLYRIIDSGMGAWPGV